MSATSTRFSARAVVPSANASAMSPSTLEVRQAMEPSFEKRRSSRHSVYRCGEPATMLAGDSGKTRRATESDWEYPPVSHPGGGRAMKTTRRELLVATGASAIGAALLPAIAGAAAPDVSAVDAFDVVVVGAGVFGAWTAYRLRKARKRVALLEAYGPGHRR